MPTPLLLTYDEAALELGGVSTRTVEREVAAGKLPVVTVRGAKRIARVDLEAYILRNRRYTTASTTCPSANVATLTTSARVSADDELSELLARVGRTRSNLKRGSGSKQSTSV